MINVAIMQKESSCTDKNMIESLYRKFYVWNPTGCFLLSEGGAYRLKIDYRFCCFFTHG